MTMEASPNGGRSESPPARRLARLYGWLATTLLTTLLLLGAVNVLAALFLAAGVGVPEPGPLGLGPEPLRAAYPGRDDNEIRRLLTEFWTRPYVYEPFTEFREGTFTGRYLNILPEGYRSAGRPQAWPPVENDRVVFVFGGSTAMGYGVADHETLPAQLEAVLDTGPCGPVTVYNFARSSYFSSQERILFEQLALAGQLPDVALFVDGLNEFAYSIGEPKYSGRLRYLMSETQAQLARRWLVQLPLPRLVKGLREGSQAPQAADAGDRAALVVERWLRNKRLIETLARELGVTPIFVWQPVRHYASRVSTAAARASSAPPIGLESLPAGYALLDRLRRDTDPRLSASTFLWLVDAQRRRSGDSYVDRVHYTAAFTSELAHKIVPALAERLCSATG